MTLPLPSRYPPRSPWSGLAALQTPLPPAANETRAKAVAPSTPAPAPKHVPEADTSSDLLWRCLAADAAAEADDLRAYLSIDSWSKRDLPQPERLLGDLITRNTRLFIVGGTGLGKTMLGLALAHSIATGTGFLHWRSARPARVLYIDGEMASELIKTRSQDAMRRAAIQPAPGMLSIYCRDFESETEAAFPDIGRMPPLNTPAGHAFVKTLIDRIGGVDAIFFDNLMSLTDGDHKDELTWSGVLPLVASLSEMRVGQVWFDHTGHDRTRQYGASVKAWRMDAVGVMTPVAENKSGPADVAFVLSFEAPHGKARRRTPENWQDFQTCTIRLAGDQWTHEMRATPGASRGAKLSPSARDWLKALAEAISRTPSGVSRETWRAQGEANGLIKTDSAGDPVSDVAKRGSAFRKHLSELRKAGFIAEEGQIIRVASGDSA